MKKPILQTTTFIFSLLLSVCPLCSCEQTPFEQEFSDFASLRDVKSDAYFNSPSTVLTYFDNSKEKARENASAALAAVNEYIQKAELQLSAEKQGDIFNFNQADAGEVIAVQKLTYDALVSCQEIYAETDGAFNPAVRLLVDLWGFTPRFFNGNYTPSLPYDRENPKTQLPSLQYVAAFSSLIDFSQIEPMEQNGNYYLKKPQTSVEVEGVTYTMQLDLGGFGKGYAADGAAQILKDHGIEYGYVSLGGSSIALLKYPKVKTQNGVAYDWKVEVRYPDMQKSASGEWFNSCFAQDKGVATSGDYERFFTLDNQRYCHIIDGVTGAPIQTGVCSAFVCHPSAAKADAYATALTVMGKEKAIDFMQKLQQNDCSSALTVRENNGFKTYQSNTSFQPNPQYANDFTFETVSERYAKTLSPDN